MIEAFGKRYDSEDAFAFAMHGEAMKSFDLFFADVDCEKRARYLQVRVSMCKTLSRLADIFAHEVFSGIMDAEAAMAYMQDVFQNKKHAGQFRPHQYKEIR